MTASRRMPALLVSLFAVVALLLTACDSGGGGSEPEPDVQTPVDTVEQDATVGTDAGQDATVPIPDVPDVQDEPDVPQSVDIPTDVGGHPCSADADCDPWAAELSACLEMYCGGDGYCLTRPVLDGTECDDGDACTTDDECNEGSCAGEAVVCDDGVECTVDTCEPATGCVYSPDNTACDDDEACTQDRCDAVGGCQHSNVEGVCDDGDLCTSDDACQDGQCVGTAVECEDDNRCNGIATCDSATGECVNGTPLVCDDDEPCNGVETCDPEIGCEPGTPPDCADQDPCTEDLCVTGEGCTHVVDPSRAGCVLETCESDADCDDEDACTHDSCTDDDYCLHTADEDCTHQACSIDIQCDDQDVCTTDTCDSAADVCWNVAIPGCPVECRYDVQCDDDNPCTEDECVEGGLCEHTAVEGVCDDGDVCTLVDLCVNGECAGGEQRNCDDSLPCTVDSCDPDSGCVNELDPTCSNVGCEDDAACDDQDECTQDTCDESEGTCWNVPIPDCGVGCESDDECDDDDPCTTDTCDTDEGECVHTEDPYCGRVPCESHEDCDDGNACTGDGCGDDGFCEHVHLPGCVLTCVTDEDCEDNNGCTTNVCLEDGSCEYVITDPDCVPCEQWWQCPDDGNDCTETVCTEDGACAYENSEGYCDDEDLCTRSDQCVDGECAGTPIVCNDYDPCTLDGCDPLTGCTTTFDETLPGCNDCTYDWDCDDDDDCTIDACEEGGCVNTALPYCEQQVCYEVGHCDDGDPCTVDQCYEPTGLACMHYPIAGCVAGTPCATDEDCADDNPCSANYCGDDGFCSPTFETPCGDRCETNADCSDGATCTTDTCDPTLGCVYAASDACLPCESSQDCGTASSICTQTGACASTHVCANEQFPVGTECSTEDPCLTGGQCDAQGECEESPVVCPESDSDPCTIDYCDPSSTGGDPCAVRWDEDSEQCNCTSDADCDDSNPCTEDFCSEDGVCRNFGLDTNCEVTANAGACDDGDSCTNEVWHAGSHMCLHLWEPSCTVPCGEEYDTFCAHGSACLASLSLCTAGECYEDVRDFSWPGCEDYYSCTVDADCVTGELTCEDSSDPDAGDGAQSCEVTTTDECAVGLCVDGSCVFVPRAGCENRTCDTDSDCEDGQEWTNNVCSPRGLCYFERR